MFRVVVLYPLGVRTGYIQLELTDYLGNDGILKRIDDIKQYFRENYNNLEVFTEQRRQRIRYSMNRYDDVNQNIIIKLEDLIERGIQNPVFNITDISRIDPEIKPTERDFEIFMEMHPNDEYFHLTINPTTFFYYLYSAIREITNHGNLRLIPFRIPQFNRDMLPKRPEIPNNFGYKIIKRDHKPIVMPNQGTAQFFRDVESYASEKRTIENFIRIQEDKVKKNIFAKEFEDPLIGKFHCLRNMYGEPDIIFNPNTLLIKILYHTIYEKNPGYFSMDMIKTYRSLPQKSARAHTFEDLRPFNISKLSYDIYQQYEFFKGDLLTLYKCIDPIINEVKTRNQTAIPKGMDFREYVFLMILYRTMRAQSFDHFFTLLSYINPDILKQFNISLDHQISCRKLEIFHSKISASIWQDLFNTLAKALVKYGIINSSILVGDGRFVHSFASDYKNPKTGTFNDSSASFTVHSEKILGLGYYCIVISSHHKDRIIPIHVELFPGSIHESKILSMVYPKIYLKCKSWHINAKYLVYDGGGYSPLNFDLGYSFGIELISPVGLRGSEENLFKAGRFSHYSAQDMPDGFGTHLIEQCLKKRGHSECIFSFLSDFYSLNRARSHSISGVSKELFLSLFLMNAKNLSAGLLNRYDLFGSPTAFSKAPQML